MTLWWSTYETISSISALLIENIYCYRQDINGNFMERNVLQETRKSVSTYLNSNNGLLIWKLSFNNSTFNIL